MVSPCAGRAVSLTRQSSGSSAAARPACAPAAGAGPDQRANCPPRARMTARSAGWSSSKR
eukprot:7723632-Lingulodinium_polyedra.AAC.1